MRHKDPIIINRHGVVFLYHFSNGAHNSRRREQWIALKKEEKKLKPMEDKDPATKKRTSPECRASVKWGDKELNKQLRAFWVALKKRRN